MTGLLKRAMIAAQAEGQTIRGIARETGLKHPTLVRFLQGKQSLRLDKADALAAYLGIECRLKGRKGDN